MIINPKSISMDELYGNYDALTQTWTDGLASNLIRGYAAMEDADKKWIIFDGPVDAIWIENMNSVLDDSMTLCLSNGERIKLKFSMKILFEVQDLAVASPATVSRCGMVYIDNQVIDIFSIVNHYFETHLRELLAPEHFDYLKGLCLSKNMTKALSFIRKKCSEPIQTVDANLCLAVCNLIRLVVKTDPDFSKIPHENFKKAFDKIYIFSFFWGFGSQLSSSLQFERMASDLFNVNDMPKGCVYDYYLSLEKPDGEFLSWNDRVSDFEYQKGSSFFDLMV